MRPKFNLRLRIRASFFCGLIFVLLIPRSLTAPIHWRPLHQESHLTAPPLFLREVSPNTANFLPVSSHIAQVDRINALSTLKSAKLPPHTHSNEHTEISLEKIVKYLENSPNWRLSFGSLLGGLSTVKLFIRFLIIYIRLFPISFSLLIICQVLRAVLKRLSMVGILVFIATRVLLLFIGGLYIDLQLRCPDWILNLLKFVLCVLLNLY